MTYKRDHLPDAISYLEGEGLRLKGPRTAKWKTTECRFHGGSDSMRVNVATGAFKCMNCGVGGGDVLDYHMQLYGLEFVQAAQATLTAVAAGNLAAGHQLTDADKQRLFVCAGRINQLVKDYVS